MRYWRIRVCDAPFDMNKRNGEPNADDPTADPQAAAAQDQTVQINALASLPAKAGRLYARLYNHSKEAELGDAESCKGSFDEWL